MEERTITEQYTRSSRCLFLLDYDGTLADFKKNPDEARLTRARKETLQALCYNPRNTVVIISGRDRETLDTWLADLPINLAAEYGNFTKDEGKPWKVRITQKRRWKRATREVLEQLVANVPGSFIEEKEFSLVWHYWDIDDVVAAAAVKTVQPALDAVTREHKLVIKLASKDVEVAVPGVDKSAVAERWLARRHWDFVLAAGDDTADEILFKAMPETVFTVKIGTGTSAARYRLPSPEAFTKLLSHFNTID